MQTAQSNSEVLVDPDTLSPETGEPFSRAMTARYLGAFVIFAILNCAAFVLNGNTLMPQHLKDLGYNETEATTALGTITSLTAIVGLLSGYIWGAFSDHTRSRFGKRTPWIFAGSIVAGIGLYLLGSFGDVPSLTASYMLNNLGQGAIQTPMFAILADRVPKSVRGTLSAGLGATALGTPVGQFLSSLFLGQPYQNMGFVVGALMIAASGIIPLLILPRERSSKNDGDGKSGAEAAKEALENLLPPKLKAAARLLQGLRRPSADDGQLCHDLPVHAVHLRELCRSDRAGSRQGNGHAVRRHLRRVADRFGCLRPAVRQD